MNSKTRPTPTRRKHEPVDDRLLATAGRCFIEDGFGFGIDDILAQSGVAKMSLYTKFGSKYRLMERLLVDSAQEWRVEIDRVAADTTLAGASKITALLSSLCSSSRDPKQRTGLVGQALIEFPRTDKQDETHKKKDQIHKKARTLQGELIESLKALCGGLGVANPLLLARQVMLLVNGYLIMEPLLGKTQALQLTTTTAQALVEQALSSGPSEKPMKDAHPTSGKANPAFRRRIDYRTHTDTTDENSVTEPGSPEMARRTPEKINQRVVVDENSSREPR